MSEVAATGRTERLRRADALIDLGRFPAALEVLAPLLAGPGDAQALARGARCLLGVERNDEAVDMAGRAIAANPDSEWAHRLRSVALMGLARGADGPRRSALLLDARESARQAVRLAPRMPVTYRNAVNVEIANGDVVAADLALQQLIRLAPDDSETWNTATLLALAQHDPVRAEFHARRAVELDPSSSEAWNNLGVAAQRQGRMSDAVASYVQSARLDPGENRTRRNITRSGLLVLRMAALVVALPLLLLPDGFAAFTGVTVVGYVLFRPGGRLRPRVEDAAVRTAMWLPRMSFNSAWFQRFLSEGLTRVAVLASIFLGLYSAEHTAPLVDLPCLAAVVLCLLHSQHTARRGRA